MSGIFISYRRDDSEGQAGRLFEGLKGRFGQDRVFIDVASIELGRDFRSIIDEHVGSCDVLLALIVKTGCTLPTRTGDGASTPLRTSFGWK
jgi:TIR domain